ncbi:26S proteasome regulatory complex, subunit RPN2 (macronuclear) [Tetrahymena thermophila SB210]|uniref:26S proteasome regulatory complex, subunit RPN2 n=1 Tax=Tetrahymena thermophila (strain SB210) TaxID=312017 RepID=I7LTL6_TETTS|nr:26S proteasome regulatory complex, subunit RPN2 [Tetrahymena thermophila SB210]EAR85471.2 26S proteasome regulatory complex, subunit RPN2 [Tetrahymena thermophila SB210]|eukprot:XP_001033134.2 26S proteasome regulatory complex, subunit RPN2 [Tetrahymena thermophila SB210]
MSLSSVRQYLQLLQEKDNELKVIGLEKLVSVVETNWAEIADHLGDIENLYEDESFPKRQLAYYLASKVYFNLEEYEDALDLALESQEYFQVDENTQFVEVLVNTCINKYITHRQSDQTTKLNPKYESIVERMFAKCQRDQDYKSGLGIAVESRRTDKINEILSQSEESKRGELVNYLYDVCIKSLNSRNYRIEIMQLLISFYKEKLASQGLLPHEYINLSLSYHTLGKYEECSQLIDDLLAKNIPLAYQVATEISETQNYSFIKKVIQALPIEESNSEKRKTVIDILDGRTQREINQKVLEHLNKSDPLYIKQIHSAVDSKKSVAHTALILCNSILNAGTGNDQFVKDNIDWAQKSQLWARFASLASLGMIHSGKPEQAKQIFASHLPKGQAGGNTGGAPNYYSNGGALYGIGIMHSGTRDPETIRYLTDIIKDPQQNKQEPILHGACLGLGLAGLASEDETLFEVLKNVLMNDSAVTGESAALAIGLIMAGTNNENAITELLKFGSETQHEKIIRATGLALALVSFGQEENADGVIESLLTDKDFILRYGGVLTVGLAYVGTSNNKAIRKLLHYAVDDVADDVRRAAVIALGFVMFNQYEQMPKIMNLLAMSYSPHVRYGTAIALGIACAGTGYQEALNMIEPMLTDTTDFVRQGAMIGTALILQQANQNSEPKLEKFKKTLQSVYSKKHEDILCKMGAILSSGIIEAGGRNQVVRLASQQGFPKLASCVGMVIFTNFWYWFPYVNFINLSFAPSALIGIDQTLRIPTDFSFKINTKKSTYDYPEPIKQDDNKDKKEFEKVTLSTTNKAKARAAVKIDAKDSKMEEEVAGTSQAENKEKAEEKTEEKEPNSYIQTNPGRVLEKQKKYVEFIENHRYQPIIKERKFGIVFLNDTQNSDDASYLGVAKKQAEQKSEMVPEQAVGDQNDDIAPPEDFVYDENQQLLN